MVASARQWSCVGLVFALHDPEDDHDGTDGTAGHGEGVGEGLGEGLGLLVNLERWVGR